MNRKAVVGCCSKSHPDYQIFRHWVDTVPDLQGGERTARELVITKITGQRHPLVPLCLPRVRSLLRSTLVPGPELDPSTYASSTPLALSGAVSAKMGHTIEQRFQEDTNELSLRDVQRHVRSVMQIGAAPTVVSNGSASSRSGMFRLVVQSTPEDTPGLQDNNHVHDLVREGYELSACPITSCHSQGSSLKINQKLQDLTSFETGVLSGRIELVQYHSLYPQPMEVTREEMCSHPMAIEKHRVTVTTHTRSPESLWEAAGTQRARLEKVELPSRRSLAGPEQFRTDPPFRIQRRWCSAAEHIHIRRSKGHNIDEKRILGPLSQATRGAESSTGTWELTAQSSQRFDGQSQDSILSGGKVFSSGKIDLQNIHFHSHDHFNTSNWPGFLREPSQIAVVVAKLATVGQVLLKYRPLESPTGSDVLSVVHVEGGSKRSVRSTSAPSLSLFLSRATTVSVRSHSPLSTLSLGSPGHLGASQFTHPFSSRCPGPSSLLPPFPAPARCLRQPLQLTLNLLVRPKFGFSLLESTPSGSPPTDFLFTTKRDTAPLK
ncbi:hypothetical protein PAXINDRAFT_155186 [Paxillus involutus ATCC 200175]|nr:hypothetical protein PAXINDRAFT_155186 [Paxillus involutus ATCC 200175]